MYDQSFHQKLNNIFKYFDHWKIKKKIELFGLVTFNTTQENKEILEIK